MKSPPFTWSNRVVILMVKGGHTAGVLGHGDGYEAVAQEREVRPDETPIPHRVLSQDAFSSGGS